MARRILEAGLPLTIWGRRAATTEPFADTQAEIAASPAAVAAASDVVGLCVVTETDVEEVLRGPEGVLAGMRPGGVIALHATIHPDACRRLAREAGERGAAFVDAPVSGGEPAARVGRLVVMTGGRAADIARCRPVFETYSDRIVPVGDVGDAQVVKLMNNLVLTAQLSLAMETLELADRVGLDRSTLCETLAGSSGGSRAIDILYQNGFTLEGIARSLDVIRKDVGLARRLARESGADESESIVRLATDTLERLAHAARAGGDAS